jgi:hypothetical protein
MKRKHPHGVFDNLATMRREIWYDGERQISHSKSFVDSEISRGYAHSMVHPWGHFPDLGEKS